jgi:hypothetical protein
MAAKKNTIPAPTATTSPEAADTAPTDSAAPAKGSVAAFVWSALTATPGASIATLAGATGLSRTSVANTLTAFETDGKVTRTKGTRDGKHRTPDTWHPITANDTSDRAPEETPTPSLRPMSRQSRPPSRTPSHPSRIPPSRHPPRLHPRQTPARHPATRAPNRPPLTRPRQPRRRPSSRPPRSCPPSLLTRIRSTQPSPTAT